jgi:hypothetical protein
MVRINLSANAVMFSAILPVQFIAMLGLANAILNRVEISDDDQPLCLDGSRFAYGFRQVKLPLFFRMDRKHISFACRAQAADFIAG